MRARIFDAFCLPRRRSRSTGADLCLVIRKLLRSRGSSLTIGQGIFLFARGPGDVCRRQFRLTFTTVAIPRKVNKHAVRETN